MGEEERRCGKRARCLQKMAGKVDGDGDGVIGLKKVNDLKQTCTAVKRLHAKVKLQQLQGQEITRTHSDVSIVHH